MPYKIKIGNGNFTRWDLKMGLQLAAHLRSKKPGPGQGRFDFGEPPLPTIQNKLSSITPDVSRKLAALGVTVLESEGKLFIRNPILEKDPEYRAYQISIAHTALTGNTLVVLPTGLGKTYIALLSAVKLLNESPDAKIIMVAPNRPLVNQHYEVFSKYLGEGLVAQITGKVKKSDREKIFSNAKVIIATPQTIEKELLSPSGKKWVNFENAALFIDEAHLFEGKYSYVPVAKEFEKLNPKGRIVAFTAAIKPAYEKIKVMLELLNIDPKRIEARNDDAPDVAPYIFDVETEKIYFTPKTSEEFKTLDTMFKKTIDKLVNSKLHRNKAFSKKLQFLKKLNTDRINIEGLNLAADGIQDLIKKENLSEYRALSSEIALATMLYHARDVALRHGYYELIRYLAGKQTDTSWAAEKLVSDPEINKMIEKLTIWRDLFEKALALETLLASHGIEHLPYLRKNLKALMAMAKEGVSHPTDLDLKILAAISDPRVVDLLRDPSLISKEGTPYTVDSLLDNRTRKIKEIVLKNPGKKIVIFAENRSTVEKIVKTLSSVRDLKVASLIGQQTRDGVKGMNQIEQSEVLSKFSGKEVDILVATSVAEFGIDFNSDIVISSEPAPGNGSAINRRGRTGRKKAGKLFILIAKDSRDVASQAKAESEEAASKDLINKLQRMAEMNSLGTK